MLTSIDLASKHTYVVCQDPCLEYHFGRGIRMGEEEEKGMVLVVEDEESSVCLALSLFVCLFLCFCFSLLSLSHSLFRCPLLSLTVCLSSLSFPPSLLSFLPRSPQARCHTRFDRTQTGQTLVCPI